MDQLYDITLLPERLRKRITALETPCWQWIGALSDKGYGDFPDGDRKVKAHRAVYEFFHGAIPDGLQVDHLCRNQRCCNPAHLELVTSQENTLRGLYGALRTHCNNGHELTEENLIRGKEGYRRICRICRTAKIQRKRAADRARSQKR